MFQTKVVDEIKTHILSSITFFVSKIMQFMRQREKNIVELGRPQMKIQCTRILCWIPGSTNKHLEYVILIALPLQQWLHERASMLLCTLSVCLSC